jgi:hypothetical protein
MTSLEYLNANAYRRFPFRENSGMAADNNWVLPNNFMVDAFFSVPADTLDYIWLSSLAIGVSTVVIGFSAGLGTTENQLGSVIVPKTGHQFGSSYQLSGSGAYARVKAVITLGDLDALLGVYSFSSDQTSIEPCLVRHSIPGLGGLSITTDGQTTGPLTGDIELVAGQNVDLSVSGNTITVSFVGQQQFEENIPEGTRVLTVNGIPVESVQIVGDDCVDVQTSGSVISISDLCSTPCCGCPELEEITRRLADLTTSLANLDTYSQALDTKIQGFTAQLMQAITE